MDLSSPLTSLIPSLDSAVLEVLAGTESALGGSKIHELSGRGSRQGLVNALERLVAHGIVSAEPTNWGSMYRLNRDHLLTPAVLLAADARRDLIRQLADACTAMRPAARSVAIFGSVARNDSNSDSDIDLVFIVDDGGADPDGWATQVDDLSGRVAAWTGNRLEAVTHTVGHLAELIRAGEPIIESWRTDAITIAGTDLRTLINHIAYGAPVAS